MCSINVHHICILKGTFNYKDETTGASSLLNDPIRFQFPSRDFSGEVSRGAARGDIFALHLAAHQRIWN